MKKNTRSLEKNAISLRRPVLLIGWGREGVKDITSAREEFPCDEGIDCVDARGADSDDVLSLIEDWLQNNPNAQFLYIGSHGDKDGLTPIGRAKLGTPKIRWAKLASSLSKATKPITLWLGACSSTFAAEAWKDDSSLLVNPIVGFSGITITDDVMKALKELLRRSNVLHQDSSEETDITFLNDDIIELPQRFPGITMHYRLKDHGFVDCSRFREITGMEFRDYLDGNCDKAQVEGLFHDVLSGLTVRPKTESQKHKTRPPCKNLGVRKLKPVKANK